MSIITFQVRLDRGVEPGGESITALGERHGLEDGGGEDGLAGDEEHHAQHQAQHARHQRHQAAVARAALVAASWSTCQNITLSSCSRCHNIIASL